MDDRIRLAVTPEADIRVVASNPLGSLDWPPFLAIPNPAPVCPKRQCSVHRFGEPENPLDVCHHHDILVDQHP